MTPEVIAARLRDLAEFAETIEGAVDHRTLRVELEALAKSLYREAQPPPGPATTPAAPTPKPPRPPAAG